MTRSKIKNRLLTKRFIDCQPNKIILLYLQPTINYCCGGVVVSAGTVVESGVIVVVVSVVTGAVTVVVSVVTSVSVVVPLLQATKNAQTVKTSNNFFILINFKILIN
jgi:hypothetical protein